MKREELTWFGPFTFPQIMAGGSLDQRLLDGPGVYLWTENDLCVAYVGRAGGSPSLRERHRQHYLAQIGGAYLIPSGFRETPGKDWELRFDDKEIVETLLDPSRFKKVVDDGFRYVRQLRVFLAPTRTMGARSADLERNLLWDLQPKRTAWGTKTEPRNRIEITHRNAGWAYPAIVSSLAPHVTFA